MRIFGLLIILLPLLSTAATVCPAGAAVAYFRLEVRRPNQEHGIPIDRVNRLQKGDTVIFFPSDPMVPMDVSDSRVALMTVIPRTGELRLLETKKGTSRQEWVMAEDAEIIAVAYGPKGFDDDKMKNATTKDPELVAQLAEYSEKTAQTELVLSALAGRRQNDDRVVDAALQGLANTGGTAKLDRTASLDQQTLSLFRTLNPAIGAYDPLAPESQQRWQQSAMLASSVAGLFFGNTVGLAGGGAALFLNMRSMMFPKTELRSALLREAPEPAMCAGKAAGSRTKFAYLWARRLPQGAPPKLQLKQTAHIAIGLPATAAVEGSEADLNSAGRAYRWKLVGAEGGATEIPVTVPANEKTLRLGAVPKSAKAGKYQLIAEWDWTATPVAGEVWVHPLPDIAPLRLSEDSAERLVANSGPVRAHLTGAPTFFVDGLQLLRLGDPLAKTMALPFAAAPKGEWLEFEVNTSSLPAGAYQLTITQRGGAKMELPIEIQSPAPVFRDLPVALHEGQPRTVTFAGTGLDRVTKLTSPHAQIEWDGASRTARITLAAKAPATMEIEAYVEGRRAPLRIPAALRSLGPRPSIAAVTRAPQQAGSVERQEGEIDATLPAAFSIKVENMPGAPELTVGCREPNLAPRKPEARQTGADTLYFMLPPNSPPNCTLLAAVNGSEPVSLGRTVALPAIAGFELTNEPGSAPGTFKGVLRGSGLEGISRTGWTAESWRESAGLPAPEGAGQRLEIEMPWPAPAPHAPLRIWLRGETEPRLTTARY